MKSLIDQQSNFTVVTTVHVRHALSVHRVNACTARRISRLPYDTSTPLPVTLRDVCPANCLYASCLRVCRIGNNWKDHCQIPDPFYNLPCMCGLN